MEIRQGYKQTEVGIIPEEWEVKKLGEIIEFTQSGLSRKLSNENIGITVLRSNNLLNGKIDRSDVKYWYKVDPQKAKVEDYFLENGDILINFINSIAQIGKSAIYYGEEKEIFTTNILRMRVKKENNLNYIFYTLNTKRYDDYIKSITKPAVNQASFTTTDFKNFILPIPPLKEQEKIAEILSYYDKAIEQQELLIEKEKEFKKGMMQKIFSQEIRFKDDNEEDYPEWEKKRLNKIANIYDGTHQTPKYIEEGIPFYSVENITSNNFSDTKFVSKEDYIENNKKRKIEKNDILMTRIGTIGKTKLIDWEVVADFYVSLALIKLKEENYPIYINQFIKSNFFQKELDRRILKVAFPQKINLTEIGECLIKLPILEEQEKIANFLSDIDNKIELLENKLELLKNEKKGMMQKLLVGEVRVQILGE